MVGRGMEEDVRHHVTLCPLRPRKKERVGEGEVARGGK